jgi:hypothetical protein
VDVDGDAGHAEGIAEHDVGRLPPEPGQGHQVLEPGRHLAAEPLGQLLAQAHQRAGLGPVVAGGVDQVLELGPVRPRVGRGIGVAGEQRRGDLVDLLVGGLGREDGRHGQLERRAEVELHPRVGVQLAELAADATRPPGPGQRRLGRADGH